MADPALNATTLATIHKAAFQQQRPWAADEFAALLNSPLTLLCGDSRAFALVRVVADEAELLTLATHPRHQRQGLAKTLMQSWQTAAQARGARMAFLEVAADNTSARRLYESAGYETFAQRPGYYSTPTGETVDAILMRRALLEP